jgi:hypothetical protein
MLYAAAKGFGLSVNTDHPGSFCGILMINRQEGYGGGNRTKREKKI